METILILEAKQKLDKSSWDFEKKIILDDLIKQLREKKYSNSEIRDLFQTLLLKEQTNAQMIANNQRYLELLDQILNS